MSYDQSQPRDAVPTGGAQYPSQPQYPAAQYPPQQFSPAGYPAGMPSPQVAFVPVMAGPRTNGLATASMVTGILAIVGFWIPYVDLVLAILAVVFGHVALNQIKRTGFAGKGMATAGLVLGYIFFAIGILIIITVSSFLAAL